MEDVPDAARLDGGLSEYLPETRNIPLDQVGGRRGRSLPPEAVDQPIRRNQGVRLERQECERRALLRSTEIEGSTIDG